MSFAELTSKYDTDSANREMILQGLTLKTSIATIDTIHDVCHGVC